MRMIDADALMENGIKVEFGYNYDGLILIPMRDVRRSIDNAPTVDAEPVRHGRWVENGKEYSIRVMCDRCSICGSTQGIDWMNYCPHCGAKMDEGGENAAN